MASNDIGIDIGSVNARVYTEGRGIILSEPSVVVYDKSSERIRAIGEEALQMAGRLNSNMALIRPIRQGTITDFVVLEKMVKYFITKAIGPRAFRKPRITFCEPAGITEIERKAVEEAIYQSGARKVYFAKCPLAAAIGAGIDILKPVGNMVVDIGGGTTDAAVLSTGGIVLQNSVRTAGETFNTFIIRYMRAHHSLFIDETAAERIKVRIGTAVEEAVPRTLEVKGRNVLTGLPKTVILTSEEVRTAIEEPTGQIVETIHSILEKLPPELASDIVGRGIVLTGGGAILRGMDKLIEEYTGVSTVTVKEAMAATVTGTGRYAAVMAQIV